MPILSKEASLFPESLLEADSWQSPDPDRRWMVVYTKPRQEKALTRDLIRRQASFYLPLVRKTRRYGRRKVPSYSPLFSGYVFLYGSDVERTFALTTNRALRIWDVEDPQRLVFDLRQLQRLIAENAPLTVESRLAPGASVRVRKGPFAGIEGTVLHRHGETRLIVSINFLQQGASIEMDDVLLEPL